MMYGDSVTVDKKLALAFYENASEGMTDLTKYKQQYFRLKASIGK